MKTLKVYRPDNEAELLAQVASARGLSVSALIGEWIEAELPNAVRRFEDRASFVSVVTDRHDIDPVTAEALIDTIAEHFPFGELNNG